MNHARPARLDALTGLRIIAAAVVFLSHIPASPFLPEVLRTFMRSGYNGVTLFFILSGFVLTWNYSATMLPLTTRRLWAFAVARFARIYPIYLLGLLLVIAPQLIVGDWDPLMLLHATTLQAWSGNVDRAMIYNSPGWSVGVEVFLYACFPLLIWGLVKIRNRPTVLLAVGAVAILAAFALAWWFVVTGRADLSPAHSESAHRWLYRMPVTRLGDFLLGAVIALLISHRSPSVRAGVAAQIVGGATMIGLMCFSPLLGTAWSWDAAYMVPVALLLWGLAGAPHHGVSRALTTKPMVILGEASFAFYIVHWFVIGTDPLIPINTDGFAGWAASTLIALTVTIAMALVAHFVIERPAQKWIRRKMTPDPASPHRLR